VLSGVFRIIFWGIISTIVFLIIKKLKIIRKKLNFTLSIILFTILYLLSCLFPIENLLVNFKSPEDIFYYTRYGEVKDIVHGKNSCMILYSTGNGAYSHLFVLKSENGYKISNNFFGTNILHTSENFEIYNVIEANDNYVFGITFLEGNKIDIFDSNGKKINSITEKIKNTDIHAIVFYDFLENFTSEYFILVNDKKIFFSN